MHWGIYDRGRERCDADCKGRASGGHAGGRTAHGNDEEGKLYGKPVKATDMEHYGERPDVIFVCVKGYSLEETIPFIRRVAKPETVVIPILNIYGTGGRLQERLPELLVTDGCIYIAAEIKEPKEQRTGIWAGLL